MREPKQKMATKKPAVKKARAKPDEVDEVIEEALGKKGRSAERFDYLSMLNDSLEVISKRQGVDTDLMEVVKPMSTGCLARDLAMGGGIRPAMYTNSGWEQCCKTTDALSTMAAAIKQDIPLIAYWDYEGCLPEDTYLSYARGKQAKLKDLFDLSEAGSWTPGSYPGQQRTDIDTVEPGHRYGGTGLRTGNLFYKGKKATTKVTFNTGHSLTGYRHKMYVLRNGVAQIVLLEDLQIGEQVLVNRKFLDVVPEEWRPVKGFGRVIAKRYEVSNRGQVRSVGFYHTVTRHLKSSGKVIDQTTFVKGKILSGQAVKDGHLWVALCDGKTQRKRLIHRIVARTFIGKPPLGKPLVLHWNDDPTENSLYNIRYGSDMDNSKDRVLRGRAAKGEDNPNSVLCEDDVKQIKDLYSQGFTVNDICDLLFNLKEKPRASVYVKRRIVEAVCCGRSWKHVDNEAIKFDITEELLRDYELAAVVSVELTGKKEHVFDVSLLGVSKDVLPHSIITNGVVTHNSSGNSIPYIASILNTMGVKIPIRELFGKKDHKTGQWIIKPRVRYNAETEGEKFFNWLSAILRDMPDKKYVKDQWWFVFDEANKVHKAKVGHLADAGMKSKYGKGLWVPAPDGKLQGIVFCDSFPAMNPDSNDDEEADRSLGVHARFFSKHLPRIKGKLARKMVALQGVNQLSEIPMAMYGPKEKEKCGNALKFNSDVRCWFTSRSSGMPYNPKFDTEERVEIERSVEFPDGKDRYRYIQVSPKKNKLSQPGRKHWLRLWVQDGSGEARGFDPFFDTVFYLRETGQLKARNRKSMQLNLHGLDEVKKTIDWMKLKTWILGTKEQKIEISKSLGLKPMDLRAFCFRQMQKGEGESLYIQVKNAGKVEEGDE